MQTDNRKLKLLKVKVTDVLKQELKTLSYLKGQTMSDTVRQLITDACQKHSSEIEEIRDVKQKKYKLQLEKK